MQFKNIKNGTFVLGDCLEVMKTIPDNYFDMILCDLPYGTTSCKWDSIIPFNELWNEYNRICKKDGAIVLTASQPFTTKLISSNISNFKYILIWDKVIPSGMTFAKYQPMRQHEDIVIFSNGKIKYNAQMVKRDVPIKAGGMSKGEASSSINFKALKKTYDYKNPTSILKFNKVRKGSLHPTQKPVELFEYLIKTYTNESDIVLDNCAGSGTTAIACENANRKWVCIEKEEKYANLAVERILKHEAE